MIHRETHQRADRFRRVETFEVEPEELGIARARPEDLAGSDPGENARVLRAILEGEAGPRRDIVCLNAGAVLWVAEAAPSLADAIPLARESIDSGAAQRKLEHLVAATREAAE